MLFLTIGHKNALYFVPFFLWDLSFLNPVFTMLVVNPKLGSLGILVFGMTGCSWQQASSPKHICEGSSPSRWFQSPDITLTPSLWIFPAEASQTLWSKDKALCCNLKNYEPQNLHNKSCYTTLHLGLFVCSNSNRTGAFQTVCFWTSLSFRTSETTKSSSHLLVASLLCNWQIFTLLDFPF